MSIEVAPLASAIGADIKGVDIRKPLDAPTVEAIKDAWHKHLVIRIREQPMSDDQLMAFAGNFGELEISGSNLVKRDHGIKLSDRANTLPPQIAVVSNIMENGKAIGNLGAGEAAWHTDSCYVDVPSAGSFLHALEVPPAGGATHFLNMYEAYEALPDPLRKRIADLKIVHAATHRSDGTPRVGYENITDVSNLPGARHPIVRTHPETGRKALYLGRRLYAYIPGLPVAESEALLDELWSYTLQDKFTWRQDWKVGDLVMWDNRCAMHRRDAFDPDSRRLMHRTQIKGTRPY